MKTPRQILFDRHEHANPKLDALREAALEELTHCSSRRKEAQTLSVSSDQSLLTPAAPIPGNTLGAILRSFRWHFAALSAAWLVVLFLNSEPSPSSAPSAMTQQNPRTDVLASLRENRRQILELLGQTTSAPEGDPPAVTPPRRSQRQSENPFVYV